MNNLGELYYYGRGVARDYPQARAWYEKAAAADNANAMYSLGWMYEKGSGVIVRDYTQATQLVPKGRRRRQHRGHVQFGRALSERTGHRSKLRKAPGNGYRKPQTLATRMP